MSVIGENISFGYQKENMLFEKLNIRIDSNEIVGIQGYSGSGKTTLGKVLAGYLPTLSGSVQVDGKYYSHKTKGFHPIQIIHQHPEKSINPRWKMEKVLAEAQMNQQDLMNRFGIKTQWLERWPGELSGGELQRFCIARAFDYRTKYIVADEITTMLDGITQAELWKEVLDLCMQRNIGLVIVSHEKALLENLCDEIIDFEAFRNQREE